MTARKKRAQTPEEQLEAALVPEEDWPYELPDNWCWVRIGSVNTYKSAPVDPSKTPDELFELYSVPSLEDDYPEILAGSEIGSTKQSVRKDDVLLCKINPRINRVWKVTKHTDETLIASSEWVVIRSAVFEPDFLMRCLSAHFFREQLLSHVSGVGGSLMRAQPRYIKDYVIPLPPLHEQRRIASRIEWLFAKLDEAEAELREVIDSSGQRQAAILHRAFNGELSESWRAMHNVNQNTWSVKRFDEVAYIRSNLVDPATFSEYPHIAPDNIEKKTGVLLPYRTIGEDGVTSGKHHFYPGQILYSKIRPYLSKAVVVDFEGLCSADMYPIEAIEDTRYLWYYILSEDFLEQTYSAGSRTVLPKINQKGLSAIKVPIPTKAEQRFISDAVDTYFESSRQAESQVMEALQQIQSLRQTILAKALHGRLGTNDPDEPSSKELLGLLVLR